MALWHFCDAAAGLENCFEKTWILDFFKLENPKTSKV